MTCAECHQPIGLLHYGDWLLFPAEAMIAHRSTVFEENSAIFRRHYRAPAGQDDVIPPGFRAIWEERHLLVVAKLAKHLQPGMSVADFAALLLQPGADLESDRFVEVHIFGPLTWRSLTKVSGTSRRQDLSVAEHKVLAERCALYHVTLEL